MTDAVDLAAIVETALTSPSFSFYDGYVPTSVPESGGYILPYVVLWAGDGEPADQQTACGLQGTSGLQWDFQTTIVTASPDVCRRVAQDVRAALTNLAAGNGQHQAKPRRIPASRTRPRQQCHPRPIHAAHPVADHHQLGAHTMPNIPAGFVEAATPDGRKRIVPKHYLDNKALGDWTLTPRGKSLLNAEQADVKTTRRRVTEPAKTETNAKEAGR